ncbi:MAG: type II toxin-antitoxin system RelE family toxin [Pseudonocardiaceae bacterium]
MVREEPFRVRLTATAQRCLRRLPEKIVGACLEFIAGPLAADPHRLGKPLQRELAGYHSARRGAYRVVYEIDDSARIVLVVRVDHRGDIYRSR